MIHSCVLFKFLNLPAQVNGLDMGDQELRGKVTVGKKCLDSTTKQIFYLHIIIQSNVEYPLDVVL